MWDAFQREVLVAMGHTLLVPAAGQAAAPGPIAPPLPAPVTGRASPPIAPRADLALSPLLQAMARAAGVDADKLGQAGPLPPLESLRTPAAKRGLWPRLRRMRSGQRR